jgi:hypothetical protein
MMKRTVDRYGQGQNPSDGKRRKGEVHGITQALHVNQRDHSVPTGQEGLDRTQFEERLLSSLQDHRRTDLFSPSRGQQSFEQLNQAPLPAHGSPDISDLIRHHRLENAAALLQRQTGFSGRLDQGNFLGFEPADLLRLSRMSNTSMITSNHQDQSLRGLTDFRDPRLSAALAGRLLPDIYGGGHQQQQQQQTAQQQQMLALTQKIFESRANNPTPAPTSSHPFMFATTSFESPYPPMNGFPAPTTDSSNASIGDEGKVDERLIPISLPSDEENLSEYQCLVRKQIYLFEARAEDVDSNAQGRNRPIVLGQVGIQCSHCCSLSPGRRTRGSVYFPGKLAGLYQAAQNMAINHFTDSCQHIPEAKRAKIRLLKEQKATIVGGGKQYWANGARVLGVQETENGLVFEKRC